MIIQHFNPEKAFTSFNIFCFSVVYQIFFIFNNKLGNGFE
jgi:hypothetical protein